MSSHQADGADDCSSINRDRRLTRRQAGASLLIAAAGGLGAACLKPRAAAAQPGVKTSGTVEAPIDGTHIDVFGKLCEAHGDAGAADIVYAMVYPDASYAPANWAWNMPNDVPDSTHWNLDRMLYGFRNDQSNYIKVWFVEYVLMGGISMPQTTGTITRYFDPAEQSSGCPPMSAPTPPAAPAAEQKGAAKSLHRIPEAIARTTDGGTLVYEDGFDFTYAAMGTRLMVQRGELVEPLKAKTVFAFAPRINWTNEAGDPVTEPAGSVGGAAGDGWRFPTAPKHALVLWQPASFEDESEIIHVIKSQDRDNPDKFHLKTSRDVFVQVNGKNSSQNQEFSKHVLNALELRIKVK